MENIIYEIVSEFEVNVTGMDIPVKARILKWVSGGETKSHYKYEISHTFQPIGAATPYVPSSYDDDYETVKKHLLKHMTEFENNNTSLNIKY